MTATTGPVVLTGNLLTDNPELYEARFPDPHHHAAHFVHDILRRFPPPATAPGDGEGGEGGGRSGGGEGGGRDGLRLLDVGCGTGRDAGHLARLGHTVTGLDNSERMLAYARRHHPGSRFVHADMRDFALDRHFDAVICLDSTLLHCHGNADLTALLTRCHAHLVSGGLLIAEFRNGAFFLGSTELLDAPQTHTVTWQGIAYTARTRLWIDHAAQLLRRERVWSWAGAAEPAEPVGAAEPAGAAEPLVQRSAWRLLFPLELRQLLDATGFDLLALFDAPGPRTDPPWRPDVPLSAALNGDRLHLVAQRRQDS